uniref:hypothetical protein n=1 Tax=Candidatus Cryptobacteroides bacterium TaxID=3085639 RepID=UPI0040275643
MRKVILILLSLLTANFVMYSQNEDIKPIVVKEKTTQGTKENHAPAKVQVECFYYSYTNSLELSFLSNLGTVDVVLENQTTGELQNYVGNSASGRMVIPIEPNTAYRMDITTENGHIYYAVFFTGCEEYEW